VIVRPATPADHERMTATLAVAFAHDPPLRFLVPEDTERLLRIHFAAVLPLYAAWVCEEPFGTALWLPPGRYPLSAAEQARLLPAQLRVFGRHLRRALGAQRAVDRHHPREPHWYLDFIAVEPAGHGRGAGSALLSDRERRPAYLNAGSPRSRDLYLRHGFEVLSELRLPFGGPPLWRMRRA
jgi:GNAT superfamily N-acetyltransferase